MKLPVRLYGAIIGAVLCRASAAHAEAALIIDEPEVAKQSTKYHLQVLGDGFASLHVKWSEADQTTHTVDFWLSPFGAAGQPTVAVGFDGGKEGARSLQHYRQGVEVPPGGAELRLGGSALVPDVEYLGQLSATVDKKKTLIWDVSLVHPGPVALFECPIGPQPVNPDGSIAIEFSRTPALRDKTIGLRLSAFTSKEQELGQVGFLTGGSKRELRRDLASTPLDGPRFIPPLASVGLTEGALYTGKILFIAGEEKMECPLALSVPKLPKGELSIDSQSLLRTVTLPFLCLFGDQDPTLAVRLFDKTRVHRVEGIVATLDGASESPEGSFDLNRHVSFSMNGTAIGDITQVRLSVSGQDESRARALLSGEQLDVDLGFKDLRPGKYAFGLRFSGVNTVSPSPKLDVTVNVRQHWLWAVFAVLIALCLSFFISKGIVNWRERVRVRDRVWQMRRRRFDDHADLPSVAFLRTVLAQTDLLVTGDRPLPKRGAPLKGCKKWKRRWLFLLGLIKRLPSSLLPPPPSVNDYLARAERVLAILDRYSALHETLEKAQLSGSIDDFYRDAIAEQMHRLGPQPLDKQTADAVLEQLNTIAGRLADPYPAYRGALRKQAIALADKVGAVVKGALGDETAVGALLKTLKESVPPNRAEPPSETEKDKERKFEDAYWILTLLYSRRAFQTETAALLKTYSDSDNLEAVFKVADGQAWQRLVNELNRTDSKTVRIEVSNTEDQESLRPLRFELAIDDPVLAESYFVLNVLYYEWHFTFIPAPEPGATTQAPEGARRQEAAVIVPAPQAPEGAPRQEPDVIVPAGTEPPASLPPGSKTWSMNVNGPRITQYAPSVGRLQVEVTVRWFSADTPVVQSRTVGSRSFPIGENTELSVLKNLDVGEILLMTIVAGVAIATSLPTLYFAKPTFGSFGDYTAILAWAIGIDQGKNLIQLLKTFPADGGAAKPGG